MRADTEVLYSQHKPLLFSLAYRMLGSVTDAEDVVQEAILMYGEQANETAIGNGRAYLCKTVTNMCINRMHSARHKRETYIGEWLPEPIVFYDEEDDPYRILQTKDSLSTAYLLLLEHLSYTERAVFLLREAFEYDYAEIAGMIGKSRANCRKIFSRAKSKISGNGEEEQPPAQSGLTDLLELFLESLHTGNIAGTLELLKDRAVLYVDGGGKVNAVAELVVGSENIVRFLHGFVSRGVFDSIRSFTVNGSPGIVVYQDGCPTHVVSFSYSSDGIEAIYIVANPDKIKHVR
jgi:RNA polymerase sigma-70 factor (TIGR02957 family)